MNIMEILTLITVVIAIVNLANNKKKLTAPVPNGWSIFSYIIAHTIGKTANAAFSFNIV